VLAVEVEKDRLVAHSSASFCPLVQIAVVSFRTDMKIRLVVSPSGSQAVQTLKKNLERQAFKAHRECLS
jgi:hypothetical protein